MTTNNIVLKDNTTKNVMLNYKFQEVDSRDYKFTPSPIILSKITSTKNNIPNFSLNQKNIIILDQGTLGSCVSNAFSQTINIHLLFLDYITIIVVEELMRIHQ